jgi:hypothetical protein
MSSPGPEPPEARADLRLSMMDLALPSDSFSKGTDADR